MYGVWLVSTCGPQLGEVYHMIAEARQVFVKEGGDSEIALKVEAVKLPGYSDK